MTTPGILCPLCHDDDYVGDEIHYALQCGFFHEERNKYLGHMLHGNNQQCYIQLFNTNCTESLKNLAMFLHLIMKIFEQSDKWNIFIYSNNHSSYDLI